MTVSPTLKGPLDSLGRRKVYIRLSEGTKRKFYATNIKIEPVYWNKKVVKHPRAKELNDRIRNLVIKYESGAVTKPVRFSTYALTSISSWTRDKKDSYLRHLESERNKFKRFSDPLISQITAKTLSDYKSHLYSLGNMETTVWGSFKFLRVILKKATSEKLILENPFDSFKMPVYRDPERVFLSESQVHDIENYLSGNCPKEFLFIGTWFLIGCFTGLRFGDMQSFDKSKIKSGRLILYTKKTRDIVSLPFDEKLRLLFDRIDYRPLNLTNEYCNRMIKIIAELSGITEKITFHVSRHTFGTLCASKGIKREIIAKLMGHADLRSTAIYSKLTDPTVDAEIRKLF